MKHSMKREAVRRLRKLQIMEETIQQFIDDNIVTMSEEMMPGVGILYWANDREKQAIKEFESNGKYVIYHGIRIRTDEGYIAYFLFVSDDEYDKQNFDDNIQQNIAYIWCDKLDTSYYSEGGTCYIAPGMGGIVEVDVTSQEEYQQLIKNRPFKGEQSK